MNQKLAPSITQTKHRNISLSLEEKELNAKHVTFKDIQFMQTSYKAIIRFYISDKCIYCQ